MLCRRTDLIVTITCVALALVATGGQAARILTVFPAVSKSHFAVGEALTVGLAEAGHDITMISPFAYESKLPNLEVVQLDGAIELFNG